jgi:hypothetical protein
VGGLLIKYDPLKLLVCFEAVSGLKVNLAKSALLPVGEVENLGELADVLGCGTASLPMKYLGLPLGASFKAKPIWDDILEKVDHRLASWKKSTFPREVGLL